LADAAFTLEEFTAGDGYRWRYRHYRPPETPRGRIVYLHGIQSHGGWYEHSSTELARAGYEVFFLDRRGSGLNQDRRGDAPTFRRLQDDVAEFLRALPISEKGRHVPAILIAISWGGKIAVALQRRHPGLVDGLALLCPGLFARVRPGFGQRLRISISRIFRPGRLFPIPLNDPELFTTTPRWLTFLRSDALALHKATARFFIASLSADVYVRLARRHVHVPVLLLLAGKDRIIDNAKTRRFIERFASNDKQVIEYPNAQHTLEFEENPECFIGDLKRWLERVVRSS